MIKLSDYTEISAFNESTSIVMLDKKIYVKKKVPGELTYIYKALYDNKNENIADIIAIYEYEDVTVVIEEYVNGRTLSDVLEEGTLSCEHTKNIIGQICDGLYFLHKINIIHRDINPNNIMISDDGGVKIVDFDIARSVKKNAGNDTVALGTVGYAAPEQFGFSQSDERTDVYAVGALANVMLTGKLPNEAVYKGRMGRVILRACSIDSKVRYKNIISFKHAFINETDENTKPLVRIIRAVPGFRSLVWWKMMLAVILYGTYIPLAVVFLSWSTDVKKALITAVSEIFIFGIPFVLITNLFDIHKKMSRKRTVAWAEAIALSAVSLILGAYIFLFNMSVI